MAGADAHNSGYLAPEFQKQVVTTDEQLPENSVFCYPNPAKNITTIRYYLNSDSQVNIDIYDYLGERIDGATVTGTAHADNEYVWNCSNAASGVYYCRVRASGPGGDVWRMIKIAVVN
jgi:Secretion system C-terminal sorting domain